MGRLALTHRAAMGCQNGYRLGRIDRAASAKTDDAVMCMAANKGDRLVDRSNRGVRNNAIIGSGFHACILQNLEETLQSTAPARNLSVRIAGAERPSCASAAGTSLSTPAPMRMARGKKIADKDGLSLHRMDDPTCVGTIANIDISTRKHELLPIFCAGMNHWPIPLQLE
jgi:hypothetical protein